MTNPAKDDFNPGDLVRMLTDDHELWLERVGWEPKPEGYFAIVADATASAAFTGQVPIRFASHVNLVWWVRPWQLELVQRGGQ